MHSNAGIDNTTHWVTGWILCVCLSVAGTMGNLARGLVSIFVVLLSVIVALVLFSGRTLLHFLINKIYRKWYIPCTVYIYAFYSCIHSWKMLVVTHKWKLKERNQVAYGEQKETHKIKAKQNLSLWITVISYWSIYLH